MLLLFYFSEVILSSKRHKLKVIKTNVGILLQTLPGFLGSIGHVCS